MATGEQEVKNENVAERGTRFLRNIHVAIGAVALAGAIIFPQVEVLSVIATYEGINALAHEGLHQAVKNRRNREPKPA